MASAARMVFGSEAQLQSAGASVANNTLSAAASTAANLTGTQYPHAKFALRVNSATNFTAMGPVTLIIRPLQVQGTNDAPAPSTTFPHRSIAVFNLAAQTADQYHEIYAYDLPREFDAYLYNQAGQTISSWDLWIIPFSIEPTP